MKKILALLLACLMLAALLAGCGGTTAAVEEEAKPASSASSSSSTAAAPAASEDEGDEDEGGEEAFTRFEELQEINVMIRVWADWEGKKEVFEEINKIAEEKLNVHMNFTTMATEFGTQLPLMLAAGEVVDLTMVPWNFANMTAQNMLLPLNDYLDEYAPYIVENCMKFAPACTIDGQIYAIPTFRLFNTSQYLIMRTDVLEALDLYDEAMAIDSWSALETLLLKVKDAQDTLPEDLQTPTIFGQQNGTGSVVAYQGVDWAPDKWSDNRAADYLGCEYIWVNPDTDKVENHITDASAVANYNRMYKWYHEGLISKDASTSQEYSDTLMANGQFFCYMSNAEYGAATAKSNNTGRDLCAIKVVDIGATTSYCSCFDWGLPSTCENPEAAVAAMNLFFSDRDVANLMVWGIEGRDYEVIDGCAQRLEGHTYEALEYFQGNQFLSYPAVNPEGAALRDNQFADNDNAPISKYFGLVIDNTEIANELTAVKNVFDKYYPTLGAGEVEATDELIAKFNDEMNAAGMDKILAFYQAACDDWNS